MSKPYLKLRAKLLENDIDQLYLAEMLGRGITYVSQRMTGKKPWSLDDMYTLMDELSIPYDQLHEYFPSDHGRAIVQSPKEERKTLRFMRVG